MKSILPTLVGLSLCALSLSVVAQDGGGAFVPAKVPAVDSVLLVVVQDTLCEQFDVRTDVYPSTALDGVPTDSVIYSLTREGAEGPIDEGHHAVQHGDAFVAEDSVTVTVTLLYGKHDRVPLASSSAKVAATNVTAGFEIESRKEKADNEAQTGEVYSSPCEIAFTNQSKGGITAYEWAIGTEARLYEREPVYQFQRTGKYNIKLTVTNENSGCAASDSSKTVEISEAALEFPNAFTPNGDGVNDQFKPAFRSLKSYDIIIYNRWGRKVFKSKDPTEGWDGKEHGAAAAAGTYFYVAEAWGYEDNTHFRRKGSITLLR